MLSAVRALLCTPHKHLHSLAATAPLTGATFLLGRPFSGGTGSVHTQHSDPFGSPPALPQRRVVVTGIGIVSPLGVGTPVTWQRLIQGDTGVRGLTPSDLPEVGPLTCPVLSSRPASPGLCAWLFWVQNSGTHVTSSSCVAIASMASMAQLPSHTHPVIPAGWVETHMLTSSSNLCPCQADQGALEQLPCRVAAVVPREQLDTSPHAAGLDLRRIAPFMRYALVAAGEVSW